MSVKLLMHSLTNRACPETQKSPLFLWEKGAVAFYRISVTTDSTWEQRGNKSQAMAFFRE